MLSLRKIFKNLVLQRVEKQAFKCVKAAPIPELDRMLEEILPKLDELSRLEKHKDQLTNGLKPLIESIRNPSKVSILRTT